MTKFILSLSLLFATAGFTCTQDGSEGIFPENDLYIPSTFKGLMNMDEDKFNEVIDSVETVYTPIVKSLGGNLTVFRKWSDGTVNAYAKQVGNQWQVHMFGGLARHSTITPDGFALVMCHEIGHHIGGAPKKGAMWASNEGQSDYWATLKCLRKVWLNENNKEALKGVQVPDLVVQTCAKQFTNEADQLICQRSSMAGMSVSELFADLRKISVPKFDTPDKKIATSTDHNHPAPQCRLDTYYHGALCDMDENTDVSQKEEKLGTCMAAEGTHSIGARPLCWFKAGGRTIGKDPGKWWITDEMAAL